MDLKSFEFNFLASKRSVDQIALHSPITNGWFGLIKISNDRNPILHHILTIFFNPAYFLPWFCVS
ncbi:hypothetical protein DF947_04300 [Pedobacter paludis]|uniref:Uncharacterized protein n=1 Tax=Pedobacter paludis TaxID=2203212 RepID=A0A317F8D4_9SPHI|nr:hypothetical protein DF947_04300 [Pedobacter paludis]